MMTSRALAVHLSPLAIVVGGFTLACGPADSPATDWAAVEDSTAVIPLRDSPSVCLECIDLQRLVVVGDTVGPGYLELTTSMVRDSLGRYWIGQRDIIKVFDATGKFMREVGRPGKGPMEFASAMPVFTDAVGNVHILDPGNTRETIVDADFGLRAETAFPGTGINAAVPLPDTDTYAVNMWMPTADRIGLPLHIIGGGEVLHSFGASTASGPQDPFRALRLLAVDRRGRVFAAKRFDYEMEAWTSAGRRIIGFSGPTLNRHEVQWAFYDRDDNPMPNEIKAIQADGADHLWVLTRRVKDNWQQHFEDHVYPDGSVGLQLKEGSTLDSVYASQIEVIDLRSHTIVARRDEEGLFSSFPGQGLILENRWLDDGTPQIAVWRVELSHLRE